MTQVFLAPDPINSTQFIPGGNTPASGAQLFCYKAGSSTKQDMFTDITGTTKWTNPLILDSGGNLGGSNEIWIPAGLPAKFVLAPSTDTDPPVSPYWTRDNISGVNDAGSILTEWIPSGLTPTFINASTFVLGGDQTLILTAGRRLKTVNTAGTFYSTVTSSVFATSTTIGIQSDSTGVDSGISSVNYGILNATNASIPTIIPYSLSIGRTGSTEDLFINNSFNTKGQLAVGGNFYSHVIATIGYDPTGALSNSGNPLIATHQVGVLAGPFANSNANGVGSFNAAFETAVGTQPGSFTLERAVNFSIAGMTKGAGTTITWTLGLSTFDETVGTNNATIARFDDSFSGNWFIHYHGVRNSALNGGLVIGGTALSANVKFQQTGTFTGSVHSFGYYSDAVMAPPINGDGSIMRLNGTLNKQGSGTHTDFSQLYLDIPVIGAGAGTLTNATTLKIIGAPSVGTNQRSLWIVAGNIDLGTGTITSNGSLGLTQGSTLTTGKSITVVNGLVTAFA